LWFRSVLPGRSRRSAAAGGRGTGRTNAVIPE
jgi:hypothetical protein